MIAYLLAIPPRLAAIGLLILLAAAPHAAAQTTITLRPIVQIGTSGPLTLGQVADVTGTDAERLSALEVVKESQSLPRADAGARHLELASVRHVLDAAGVNWGRVTLKGSACEIRLPVAAPAAPAPLEKKPTLQDRFACVDIDTVAPTGVTLRQALARRLSEHYECAPQDLRLAFSESDREKLERSTSEQRIEIMLGTQRNSARTPARVALYQGERVTFTGSFDVEAQVRRPVLVAAERLDRNDAVNASNTRTEERWIAPGTRTITSDDLGAQGLVASARLDPDELITLDQVQSPIAAKRGDIVWVHCLSGGISVRAKCRAMSTARDGELVTLRLENSKQTFQARMSGPGRAVKLADQAETQPARAADAAPDQVSPDLAPTEPGGSSQMGRIEP